MLAIDCEDNYLCFSDTPTENIKRYQMEWYDKEKKV